MQGSTRRKINCSEYLPFRLRFFFLLLFFTFGLFSIILIRYLNQSQFKGNKTTLNNLNYLFNVLIVVKIKINLSNSKAYVCLIVDFFQQKSDRFNN